jgi:hypothetical protein
MSEGREMASHRVLKGVLHNFLGTYTSRYSDFDGYWLFGFLVGALGELEFDLLRPRAGDPDSPLDFAASLAATKFADEMCKAGIEPSRVLEARLTIKRSPDVVKGPVNHTPCCGGYHVTFRATAVVRPNRRYERETLLFVAPHDPQIELRSGRAQ